MLNNICYVNQYQNMYELYSVIIITIIATIVISQFCYKANQTNLKSKIDNMNDNELTELLLSVSEHVIIPKWYN